ncbi:MAG TPA: S-layer homology domain-containing protein [Thermoanaerobaculia bacterium]|nr:S-layer homology domain-containing protein [Thermoanaerobaculia bacterium]
MRAVRTGLLSAGLVFVASLCLASPLADGGILHKTIGYTEFLPLESSVGYARSSTANDGRYATSGGSDGSGTLAVTLDLPSGALVKSVEFDFCANNPGNGGFTLQLAAEDKSGVTTQLIPMMGIVGTVGCQNVVKNMDPFGLTVDNGASRLVLQVQIVNGAFDGTFTFSGAVVGYQLQVSPAPETATFNDVPTDDPGFPFIEAFAASGITQGCGGGNYCPDAAVTRRQIAVFFAKALGLAYR